MAGVAIGAGAGYLLGLALRRNWLPEFLHNLTVLGIVFAVYVVSNTVEHETGLLAVTVMGLWLANMRGVHTDDILDFKESLSILLISGLFIILAARIDFGPFKQLGWSALGVFIALQFFARPLKIFLTTMGSALNWRERTLLGWIGPRGIVAAAISAVFGLRLEQAGFSDAVFLVPLSFMVIIGTVLLQGATAGVIARLLGVAEPESKGFLIVGANRLAREIARHLGKAGYRTLLADTSWENTEQARKEGLDTYYGNPVSEHADRHLDLVGFGRLLGRSPHTALSSLAVLLIAGSSATAIYTRCTAIAPNNRRISKLRLPNLATNCLVKTSASRIYPGFSTRVLSLRLIWTKMKISTPSPREIPMQFRYLHWTRRGKCTYSPGRIARPYQAVGNRLQSQLCSPIAIPPDIQYRDLVRATLR